MLDKAIIEQLNSIFKNLSANYTLEAKIGKNHDEAQNTKAFFRCRCCEEIPGCSKRQAKGRNGAMQANRDRE